MGNRSGPGLPPSVHGAGLKRTRSVTSQASSRPSGHSTPPPPSHASRRRWPRTTSGPAGAKRGGTGPLARHLAEHRGVDLTTLHSTGAGGRITRADVEHAVPPTPQHPGSDARPGSRLSARLRPRGPTAHADGPVWLCRRGAEPVRLPSWARGDGRDQRAVRRAEGGRS
ncbi:E3 binding domain-containing protein [Streptomyces sp. NPDC088254]|uniref:E3 binding domain-containing protein n=1 Tax=Streptomyces sp. NPDC088254 TaxID=3365847 RepID=UPI00382E67B0